MESRFYRYKVKVPLYRGYFHIVLTDSVKDYNSNYNDDYISESDYIFGHSIFTEEVDSDSNDGCYVMVLNLWADKRITHGIIAHEALHITNFILNHVGSNFDDDNHEHYAYLLEWVVGVVYDFLRDEGLMDLICVGMDDVLGFCDHEDINIDNSFYDDVPGEGDGGVDNIFVGDSIDHTCPPAVVTVKSTIGNTHVMYMKENQGVLISDCWVSKSVYDFLMSNNLIHKI